MEAIAEEVDIESLGNGRFAISGALTFETAETALAVGERLFEHFQELELDFAQVQTSDSAGLAVIIEWISRANREDKEIRLRNIPAQLMALAGISEVENLLPMAGDRED